MSGEPVAMTRKRAVSAFWPPGHAYLDTVLYQPFVRVPFKSRRVLRWLTRNLEFCITAFVSTG